MKRSASAIGTLPRHSPGMDPKVLLREFLKANADPADRRRPALAPSLPSAS
jgi:hypothetical protein